MANEGIEPYYADADTAPWAGDPLPNAPTTIAAPLRSGELLTSEMASALAFADLAVDDNNAARVFRWLALYAALPDPMAGVLAYPELDNPVAFLANLVELPAGAERLAELWNDPYSLKQAALYLRGVILHQWILDAAAAQDWELRDSLVLQYEKLGPATAPSWLEFTGLWSYHDVEGGVYDLGLIEFAVRAGILGGSIDSQGNAVVSGGAGKSLAKIGVSLGLFWLLGRMF